MAARFPSSVSELTPELLTEVMAEQHRGVKVEACEIVRTMQCGDGFASTADRVILRLQYAPGRDEGLPEQVMLKTMLLTPHAPGVMYENEVAFYRDLRSEMTIEVPQAYGSLYDSESGQFGVIMEDLGLRDARFPNATTPVSLDEMRGLVTTLATLHAHYWQSPRFDTDLKWIATPCARGMYTFFHDYGLEIVSAQVDANPYKAELISQLEVKLPEIFEALWKVQAILDTQPTTLLHGDPHIGNTYLLPDGTGGLLDWQLMVRGRWAHDLTYTLITGLDTESRRAHERELIEHYLVELRARGVESAPSLDEAWELHRKTVVWGLFIGWLICPTENYGQAITEANIARTVQAAIDLDTFAAIAADD
jgi:hypothetical protein